MSWLVPFSCVRNHILKSKFLKSVYLGYAKKIGNRRLTTCNCFTFERRLLASSFDFHTVSGCSKFSKDSKVESPDEETQKAVFEDVEFQSILRDFAKDFEIDEESSKVLDDIRKNQDFPEECGSCDKSASDTVSPLSREKFKEFRDDESTVIYSIEEESKGLDEEEDLFHIDKEYQFTKVERKTKRGITGVYDIEELVAILREEKLYDIVVIKIPPTCHYADYMVLANAKSLRHATAVCQYILKLYKMKRGKNDPFVVVEGEKLGPWKAVDMGNIVLHVFLEDTRTVYDIESLWLFDSVYDSGGQAQDEEEMDIVKEQIAFLESLKLNDAAAASHSDEQLTP